MDVDEASRQRLARSTIPRSLKAEAIPSRGSSAHGQRRGPQVRHWTAQRQSRFGGGEGNTEAGCHLWPTHPLNNSPSYILRTAYARTDRGNGRGVISGGVDASESACWRQVRGAGRRPCPCVFGAPGGSLAGGGEGEGEGEGGPRPPFLVPNTKPCHWRLLGVGRCPAGASGWQCRVFLQA
jgi:hypothetical protein